MKLALIPPFSLLTWAFKTNYQLMLPQLLSDKKYRSRYASLCDDPTQYVILDNGAAEGAYVDYKELKRVVDAYKPDELVLPDVLGDGPNTVQAVHYFMEEHDDLIGKVKLGVVAAGSDRDEALKTVLDVVEEWDGGIDVIYIPRSLVTVQKPHERLYLASDLVQMFDLPIHFLGTNPVFMNEVALAAKSKMVRGVDTSAPFNYAYAGQVIHGTNHVYRPEGYFDIPAEEFYGPTVRDNVELLMEWCRD